MIQENLESKKKRALEVIRCLKRTFPKAGIELHFKNPIHLVVATILSAQCTDKRVNLVTPYLFKKYKTAKDYANANIKTFEKEIHSTGFYRAKAKNIIGCMKGITKQFGGKVPNQMEDLIELPGIGRKTANVILGNIFDVPGLVVDTHMKRIANRLGLTRQQEPVKIEFELNEIIPRKEWTLFSHLIIWHGRRICFARSPKCSDCPINVLCPSRQDVKSVSVGLKRVALAAR
ncbi:MAG: endonuclease III [Candidatus Omnitrophica bacterium]|nr:endonuclease III [Candidatus Omnitrophota bacterium]